MVSCNMLEFLLAKLLLDIELWQVLSDVTGHRRHSIVRPDGKQPGRRSRSKPKKSPSGTLEKDGPRNTKMRI